MKLMILISTLIIIPNISCNKALFDALDKALRTDSNLYQLHSLLYPGSFQANTVQLVFQSFTVGNITDPFNFHGRAGFIRCNFSSLIYYCFNSKSISLPTVDLSANNAESDSYSRLHSLITDNMIVLELFDYVSFKLFSLLTLSQLFEYRNHYGYIHLAIDELQKMPDYNVVVAELQSVLGWVSLVSIMYA